MTDAHLSEQRGSEVGLVADATYASRCLDGPARPHHGDVVVTRILDGYLAIVDAMVRQQAPYEGLYEFSGWYGTVGEFLAEGEAEWLARLEEGCARIGRNLNDTRGLIHSFTDCRKTMLRLFEDLEEMASLPFPDWEIVFELRMNRARWIRIYADVLVITPGKVFSLEFKMKDAVDPEEVLQAAKYAPYLEILFGREMDIVPALVLTGAADLFEYVPIGRSDCVLPVCSGDMLFNVLNEYLGFLQP